MGIIAKNQQDPDYFPRKIQAVGETIGKMCRSTWEAIKLYRRLKYAYEAIESVYETGSRYVQEMGKERDTNQKDSGLDDLTDEEVQESLDDIKKQKKSGEMDRKTANKQIKRHEKELKSRKKRNIQDRTSG